MEAARQPSSTAFAMTILKLCDSVSSHKALVDQWCALSGIGNDSPGDPAAREADPGGPASSGRAPPRGGIVRCKPLLEVLLRLACDSQIIYKDVKELHAKAAAAASARVSGVGGDGADGSVPVAVSGSSGTGPRLPPPPCASQQPYAALLAFHRPELAALLTDTRALVSRQASLLGLCRVRLADELRAGRLRAAEHLAWAGAGASRAEGWRGLRGNDCVTHAGLVEQLDCAPGGTRSRRRCLLVVTRSALFLFEACGGFALVGSAHLAQVRGGAPTAL
jgi:hypothetical protein